MAQYGDGSANNIYSAKVNPVFIGMTFVEVAAVTITPFFVSDLCLVSLRKFPSDPVCCKGIHQRVSEISSDVEPRKELRVLSTR